MFAWLSLPFCVWISVDRETRVWRLVVRGVLPGHGDAVLPVLHQRRAADAGGVRGGVDPQCPVVRGPPDDLLPPVAEDVGRQRGGGLGAVVRRDAGTGQQAGVATGAVLVDMRAVQQLPLRVAVPPDDEVRGAGLTARHPGTVGTTAKAGDGRRPGLGAGAARPDVGGDG